MYEIEMHQPTEQFGKCWLAAARHLQSQAQDGLSWLKAVSAPPFLEHLSFRIGNQLFFVRVESTESDIEVPGTRRGLLAAAEGFNGHACLLPMSRARTGWAAQLPGWGLVSLATGKPIDPIALVYDEKIEMTDWELHDFAVQMVRDMLEKEGREVMSWCGNPGVDPAIWFIGEAGPEWIVVRTARHPPPEEQLPHNIAQIADSCRKLETGGNFASVAVCNADQSLPGASDGSAIPLWRGHGMHVRYAGLQKLRE